MMLEQLNKLQDTLQNIPQADYSFKSRVHPLKTFLFEGCKCYVKRDDELGGVFGGSKMRKYRSLIPFLLAQGFSEVIVIGGAYSNNVLGVTQLLLENGIKPTLFLRGEEDSKPKGNALFSRLLVPSESIHWIPRKAWIEVRAIADVYCKQLLHKAFVLEEGSSTPSALAGSLTLALDILRNEADLNLNFDHIFVEAGTGMMASTLILAMSWLQKQTKIHVLLMADGKAEFDNALKKFHVGMEQLFNNTFPIPINYHCYMPNTAKSFGTTNKIIFQNIKNFAQTEGFFCDPIYTSKLFSETHRIIAAEKLVGNILVIHSGGTFTLSGFQDHFVALV